MPAKSEKQRRYMAMAYNDPDMGIPKEVAKKFMKKPAGGYKKGGKVGYHKMPDGTMMKDSEHKMKKGGKVKKYMSGGRTEAMKSRDDEMMRKGPPRRPRLGPNRDMMNLENEAAMMRKKDQKKNKMMEAGARGTAYKKGGKVRGAGKAQKGVRPCKMV